MNDKNFSFSKKKISYLFVTVLAFCFLGFVWSAASPLGSSPDEDAHIASIWCAQGFRDKVCSPSTDGVSGFASIPIKPNICYRFVPSDSANCGTHFGRENVRTNNVNYPQLFYQFNSLFISSNVVNSIVAMRTVNFATYVLLTTFAISLLPSKLKSGFALAWITTLIPLGVFVAASINPSSWALSGLFSSAIFMVASLSRERARKIRALAVVGLSLSSVVALGSRPDSKLYLPVILVLAAISTTTLKISRVTLKIKCLALITAVGFASLFYSKLILLFSSLTYSMTSFPDGGRSSDLSLLFHNIPRALDLWFGIFGVDWGTGWFDTVNPMSIGVMLAGIYIFLVLTALPLASRRIKLILLFGFFFFFILVLATLQVNHLVVRDALQPRYFLPFIAALSGIFFSRSLSFGTLSRIQIVVLLSLFTYAHSYSLYWNQKRYITGIDDQGWSLNQNIEWWFNSDWQDIHRFYPSTFFFFGSALFLLGTLTGYRLLTTENFQKASSSGNDHKEGTKRRGQSPSARAR